MIFFKKKNKTIKEKGDASQLVSAKPEIEKEKPVSNSRKNIMYKFKPVYSNYESIETVVNIIEETGITLDSISTHGIFNSYRDAYREFTSMSCADSFLNGFRLGGKFAVDMLA